MLLSQRSIAKPVVFVGKGLHSGRIVRMEVHPASANYGIRFLRTDSEKAEIIPATYQYITATDLCTTVGSGANSVATIEHLMAALSGLGIDNALIRLNGPEVPIMDGSARPFITEFMRSGIVDLDVQKRFLVVKETFEFKSGDRYIKIEPSKDIQFRCEIDFSKSFIGHQFIEMKLTEQNFLRLADARTFCHLNEVNALRSMGLALGGSLENAVVVTDEGVLNEEGLRGEDEFVRHKLLDCIGDLALLGATLVGKITVKKPGHGFHAEVMNKIMMNKSKYFTIIEASTSSDSRFNEVYRGMAIAGGAAY